MLNALENCQPAHAHVILSKWPTVKQTNLIEVACYK